MIALTLTSCGIPPAVVTAGLGLAAGEAKLGTALVQWLTVRDAVPPDCGAAPVPPCVLRPAITAKLTAAGP